jgi:PAP2 superfamily
MDDEVCAVEGLDRLIWAVIVLVAVFVVTALLLSNFHLAWQTFAAPALACSTLLAGGWFYSRWRADARLASGLFSTAQLVAFAAVAAPLSYIAASANLPLCDAALDTMDRALGFDWKALLAWMNTAPFLYRVLRPIYLSLTLQMTTVVLCLAFSGRHLWLRTYTLAFLCAALVCIAISAALPAAGAWPHYGLTASDSGILPAVSTSWPVFYGLRDGSFRVLVAVGSEGIITFPSLHAALAVLVTAALWPVRYLRWAAVILNTAMLIATPIDGSHYFSDVLAGVALAALSLLIAQTVAARMRAHPQRRGGSSRRAHAASSHSPAGDQLARAPFVPSDARQRR